MGYTVATVGGDEEGDSGCARWWGGEGWWAG